MSHTPGPWKVTPYDELIYIDHDHGLVEDYWSVAQAYGPEAQANAHLIAAAPELLAAALIATAEIECYCCDIGIAVKGICGKCHLVQAIRRAEGRQP